MTKETSRGEDEVKIRAVIENWAEALRTKDAKRLVSNYAEYNVMFVLSPPLQYTRDNAPGIKGVEEWFATFRGPLGYEIRDLHITAVDGVAFCHSLNRLSGVKSSGEKTELWFRETLCLRKVDGNWKIAHQHESVPFYMNGSNKAAIDLKP